MLHHCGLLDPDPEQSRMRRWVRQGLNYDTLPPDVQLEIGVWLHMPGFTWSFHCHTLGHHFETLKRWASRTSYDTLRPMITDNWISTTRDDCIRLANLRRRGMEMPLVCQIQIVEDLRSGISQRELGTIYKTTGQAIGVWRRKGFSARWVPSGFEWLVAQSVT